MVSFTNVECPHCGAKGKIITPPVGAIIVGPCPACKDMVAIFCGCVLPLDTTVMNGGSVEERRRHLLEVLTRFLEERLARLFNEDEPLFGGELTETEDEENETPAEEGLPVSAMKSGGKVNISQEEFDKFVNVDLSLLDNKDYFRAVFG